jgi:hypothetical protein
VLLLQKQHISYHSNGAKTHLYCPLSFCLDNRHRRSNGVSTGAILPILFSPCFFPVAFQKHGMVFCFEQQQERIFVIEESHIQASETKYQKIDIHNFLSSLHINHHLSKGESNENWTDHDETLGK